MKPLTRFGEFELLKALAILGLPAVHLMEEALEDGYASPGLEQLGAAVIGLCAFGPSVFMICMGFGIGGGRTSQARIRQSGIQFLLIGAILNILRWLIPGALSALVLHTRLMDDVDFCLESDIYYFAGLFFVFYSFIKRWKIQAPVLLMICTMLLTANTLLTPLTHRYVTDEIAAAIVGNFVYVDNTSCFPLLSWAIFPSVGILLGEVLKPADDRRREQIMRRMLGFALVLFCSFAVFLVSYGIDLYKALVSPADDYITDLPNVVLLLSLALLLVGLAYQLCKRIGDSPFMAFMLRISAFIIPFYLLQWVIVSWIFYLLPMFGVPLGSFTLPIYLATATAILALCIVVTTRHGMKIMKTLLKLTTVKKRRGKRRLSE